jgi:hypothetical protein
MRLNVRTLGMVTMATSPLMLVEYILAASGHLPGGEFGRADAIIGLVYLGGFLSAVIALNRLQVTGDRGWKRIYSWLQVGLLFMAAQQQVMEISRTDTSSKLFGIADAAWPLSHISMCGTGVAIVLAQRWRGYRAVLPFLCGLAVPALIAVQTFAGKEAGRVVFAVLVSAGFGLLGQAVRSEADVPNGAKLRVAARA